MTDGERIEALGAEVDAALAVTERRVEVEGMQQVNDAALQRLAQQGVGVDNVSVLSVRLAVLVEYLLGDMDDPRRLGYEHAVQSKFSALIADVGAQAARAKLLNGVRIDPKNLPGQG